MPRSVAFLRAINVGKHRRVAMPELREVVVGLGFEGVATYINSGNVVLDTRAAPATVEARIEPALAAAFGFEIPTFVRRAAEIGAALHLAPFGPVADGHTWSITFLRSAPDDDAVRTVQALSNEVDTFAVHGADLHWHIAGSMMDSTVKDAALAKATGGLVGTNRNTTMLAKLLVKSLAAQPAGPDPQTRPPRRRGSGVGTAARR